MAEIKKEIKEMSPNLRHQRDKESQPVRGKFIFHEVPGGRMDFPFRKFKGPIETYHLTDGEITTVPLAVYRHLNENCWYPSYEYKTNEAGQPVMKIGQKIRRCSFQSLEFLDIDEGPAKVSNPVETALPAL